VYPHALVVLKDVAHAAAAPSHLFRSRGGPRELLEPGHEFGLARDAVRGRRTTFFNFCVCRRGVGGCSATRARRRDQTGGSDEQRAADDHRRCFADPPGHTWLRSINQAPHATPELSRRCRQGATPDTAFRTIPFQPSESIALPANRSVRLCHDKENILGLVFPTAGTRSRDHI
jgi:hypothetical protein